MESESFELRKGEMLLREGEERNGIYHLEKGILKLVRSVIPGRPSTLIYLREGDLIGLDAMIHDRQHGYSVVATTHAELVKYPEERIRGLMEAEPEFQLRLIRDLCSRIQTLDKKVHSILMKSTAQRLADHILHLLEMGTANDEGELDFKLEEVADHVGTTPDYLHKVIIEMSKEGALNLQKEKLRILDSTRLQKIAEGG